MKAVRAALATCLLALTWWVGDGGAGAADLEAYSWWWRGNTGPAPLPVPASVPEGGILIGGAPDGATAVAAVRYQLVGGESSPTLVLRVAEERGGDVAVIAACPSGSAWGPNERGGPWDAKPNPACELGSVNGQRDATAGTWTFPLAPIVQSDVVDVVIVPGTISPEAPVGSTFQIAFHPPDPGALTTSSTSGDPSATATDADFPAPVVAGEFNPDLPSGGLDVTPSVDIPVATPFTPALPPSSQGITATAPAVQLAQPPRLAAPASSSRGGAGLAFFVLLAALGAMYWANRVPVPPPRRLGPLSAPVGHVVAPAVAAPEAGGLGRFARPRRGAPPPLV